LKLAWFKFNCR